MSKLIGYLGDGLAFQCPQCTTFPDGHSPVYEVNVLPYVAVCVHCGKVCADGGSGCVLFANGQPPERLAAIRQRAEERRAERRQAWENYLHG